MAVVCLFLPWYTAATGGAGGLGGGGSGLSANALSLGISAVVLASTAVAVLFTLVAWGRGWGRLSMLLAGLGGVGMVFVDFVAMSVGGKTYTTATVQIHGRDIPAAALNPGVGLMLHLVAGGAVVVFALAGLAGSFVGSDDSTGTPEGGGLQGTQRSQSGPPTGGPAETETPVRNGGQTSAEGGDGDADAVASHDSTGRVNTEQPQPSGDSGQSDRHQTGSGEAFVERVAAKLENGGWQTSVTDTGDERVEIAALDPETDSRRLLHVHPSTDAWVTPDDVESLAQRVEETSATEAAVVTRGTFDAKATDLASEYGIEAIEQSGS